MAPQFSTLSAQKYIDGLVDGTLALLTGSGTSIDPKPLPGGLIWSSTVAKGYQPTFGFLHPFEQQRDPDRIRDERDGQKHGNEDLLNRG